ncbi:MAG: hypothetical protein UT34_C0001G0059 [candidate division WS6 bacterium GW2011_GWF2_39_15]|uniref:Uncharacterized protein n=1 Tax=candidate division WS6 bacterium GW2011_GWF2_39_15 TaxID=1619100 RepID=A0A0G0MPN1_9BACT|nr:MAG: hypothetical protein UT34_C0001G0059 [candidate division WS6 bacterium GW2011_GWF2_39_15]
MIDIKQKLSELSLTSENAIVIGSGILNALNIRESHDIDVIVDTETYNRLKQNPQFIVSQPLGLDVLQYDIYEIVTGWNMTDINKVYSFEEIFENSTVIDGVRYNSLEFLLTVKKIWVGGKNPREKDKKDIEIIENYLKSSK